MSVRERRQAAYQAADANRLVAEPGLAADIASIAAVATAYAFAVLDPTGSRAPLPGFRQGFRPRAWRQRAAGYVDDLFSRRST